MGWEDNVPNGDFDDLQDNVANYKNAAGVYSFGSTTFENYAYDKISQGYIEEFYSGDRCFSGMINNPGISLMPTAIMGPAYLVFLGYLFLGISISADIFMVAIDVITSKT